MFQDLTADLANELVNNEERTSFVKKEEEKKSLFQKLNEIGTISQKEIVDFTRHVAVMLGAGVTVFETIQFLRNQATNNVFKGRLDDILKSINNGQPFSSALSKFPKIFPSVYVNIVRVGEQSGALSETMHELADYLEDSENFKRRVKGAMIYPKIIGFVMLIFIVVLVVFVMPRILKIFDSLGAEIPLSTKIVIAITNFVNNHYFLIIGFVFGAWLFIKSILKSPKIQKIRDLAYIRIPVVGHIVLNYNTAQISQHFGTLFSSGITILKCLEITKSVISNKIFREEIEHMIEQIKVGTSLSESFKKESRFPPMFVKLISVGERTGKLQAVIDYMKRYYKNLVDGDVKNISAIIEPVLMVVLGLLVAVLVVTVIGPIYQLISSVGN